MRAHCCLRTLITLLHAVIGAGTGFFCLYSLIGWNYETTCLPKLVDNTGALIPIDNCLPTVCESLVYGMGVLCLLNFAMCLVINCCWQNACVAFISAFLTIIYMGSSIMGGTALGVYYSLWCDSLERKFVGSRSCGDAALRYDQFNSTGQMSMYKTRMEVQMTSLAALFPVTCMAVLTYLLAMRIFAKPDSRDGQFRYIIHHDETEPLIGGDNRVSREVPSGVQNPNLPNGAASRSLN